MSTLRRPYLDRRLEPLTLELAETNSSNLNTTAQHKAENDCSRHQEHLEHTEINKDLYAAAACDILCKINRYRGILN